MTFSEFIQRIAASGLDQDAVFSFVSKKHCSLFLSLIKRFIEKNYGSLTIIDMSTVNMREFYGSLEISFLGQKNLFWLTNIHELNQKNKGTLFVYLEKYKGPNIIFLSDQQEVPDACIIELPEHVGYKDFELYFAPCYETPLKQVFFKEVFKRYPKLSLDSVVLLINYSYVISKSGLFFEAWLPNVVESSSSLFVLSTYFFGKNEEAFWRYWSLMYQEYSDPFWTVFWGDQLFRAYSFITYTKQKKIADAKKISYNLPFTFMQRDWKNVSCLELANAHQFITSSDWKVKNGMQSHFQLFFLKYFSGEF